MRWLVLACLLPLPAQAQDDRGVLTAFLEDNLSGAGRQVTVTGFSGALSSQARVDSLTIADDRGVWLTLNGVTLDWSRSALFAGRLQVSELVAQEVILDRLPDPAPTSLPSPEAPGFSLPDLPVSVEIGRLAAARVVLGESVLGQPVQGTLEAALTLNAGQGRAALGIVRGDAGPAGRIALAVSYANDTGRLEIDLSAREDAGGIAATLLGLPGAPSAALTVQGAGPLSEFAADIRLATGGQDRLAGQVVLQGAADGAQAFRADLSGDLAPLFLPDYAAFFGNDLRLTAQGSRAADGALDLSAFGLSARAVQVSGRLQLAADGVPVAFEVDAALRDPGGGPVLLPLSGSPTRVGRAALRLAFDAGESEAWTGRATLDGLDRADLKAGQVVLDGSGRIGRQADGKPVFGGSLTVQAEGLAPADPALAAALGDRLAGTGVLSWQAGTGLVRVGVLRLEGADYGAEVTGTIEGLSTGYRLTGGGGLRAADLSRFSALAGRPLSGRVEAQVTGSGSPLGGDFDLEATVNGRDLAVGQAQADGLLRGESRVTLSALRDGTGTLLRALTVEAGGGQVTARGRVATRGSDLTANLALPDLSVLGPGWNGGISTAATFKGTPADGRLTLDGTARDLMAGVAELDALLRGEGRIVLDARLLDGAMQLETARIDHPNIQANGRGRLDPAGSDLTVDAVIPDLAAMGGTYRGRLEAAATLTGTPEAGRVVLTGAARDLRIGQAEADRLLAGDSRIEADLALDGGRLTINAASLQAPQITAQATGTATGSERRIALTARLANLALLVPEFPGPLTAEGTIVETAAGADVDIGLRGPGQIDATVRGRMAPGYGRGDLAIAGTAQAALANAFLGSRSISGRLGFELRMNGTPGLAALSGPVTLSDGRLADPDLPFSLTGLSATARLAGGAADIAAQAQASTGGGLTVGGRVGLTAPYGGDLTVNLRGFRLRDPDLFETTISGALSVAGPLTGGARIAGQLNLAETELRIPDTGLGSQGQLPGLRHLNEPGSVRETRRRAGLFGVETAPGASGAGVFTLDVLLSAPNRLFLRGRGLDAELGGELRLLGTTAAIVPSGAFTLIRGRLDILGKRLVLTSARLDLQGDLIPTIEVAATNTSDGVATSVVIRGRADAPEVTFESAPELPQEEVLARLLFGRGIENISALQAAQLANAVARLAGRGGEGIVARLRKGFGLDDLDIATSEETGATLRAGKYISDNVYTEVEVDQGGKSRINLNLDLRPGVTMKGTVGSDGGTGVGVYLERDY